MSAPTPLSYEPPTGPSAATRGNRTALTIRPALLVALAYLLPLELLMWLPYYRLVLPLIVLVVPVSTLVIALALGLRNARLSALLVLVAWGSLALFLLGPVTCAYCHDSDQNVKGGCVKIRRDGWCDEDYYPWHHNKGSCRWCAASGRQTRLESWLD